MTGSQACKRGLDNMTLAVLVGIFIDKAVGTTSRHSGSENALSFRTGPVTGLFALFECLNCAGCQGGASSLCDALLTFITLATTAMATATSRV
jgi:hypothetical protein